jgi:hypothetical protein
VAALLERLHGLDAMEVRWAENENERRPAVRECGAQVRVLACLREERAKRVRVRRQGIDQSPDTQNAAFFELLEWLAVQTLRDGTASDDDRF